MKWVEIMKTEKKQVDLVAYRSMMVTAARLGNTKVVEGILEVIKSDGFDLQREDYTIVIDGYVKIHDFGTAMKYFKEMMGKKIRPGMAHLHCFIREFSRIGKMDSALQVYNMVKQLNLKPNLQTMDTLLRGYDMSNDFQGKKIILKEMRNMRISPGIFTLNNLFRKCIEENDEKEGMLWVNMLVRLDLVIEEKILKEVTKNWIEQYGDRVVPYCNMLKEAIKYL